MNGEDVMDLLPDSGAAGASLAKLGAAKGGFSIRALSPRRNYLNVLENPLSSDSARYFTRWGDNVREEFRRAMRRRAFYTFVEVSPG